jgi:hypothetical protein
MNAVQRRPKFRPNNPFVRETVGEPSDDLLDRALILQASLRDVALDLDMLVSALRHREPAMKTSDLSRVSSRQLQAMDS